MIQRLLGNAIAQRPSTATPGDPWGAYLGNTNDPSTAGLYQQARNQVGSQGFLAGFNSRTGPLSQMAPGAPSPLGAGETAELAAQAGMPGQVLQMAQAQEAQSTAPLRRLQAADAAASLMGNVNLIEQMRQGGIPIPGMGGAAGGAGAAAPGSLVQRTAYNEARLTPTVADLAGGGLGLAKFAIDNAKLGGLSSVADVHPTFANNILSAVAAMPPDIAQRFAIISGFRSAGREQDVYDQLNAKRAKQGLAPLNVPNDSYHSHGMAVDINRDPAVQNWINQNGWQFNIGFPLAGKMAGEDNHLEPVNVDPQTHAISRITDPSGWSKANMPADTGGPDQVVGRQSATGIPGALARPAAFYGSTDQGGGADSDQPTPGGPDQVIRPGGSSIPQALLQQAQYNSGGVGGQPGQLPAPPQFRMPPEFQQYMQSPWFQAYRENEILHHRGDPMMGLIGPMMQDYQRKLVEQGFAPGIAAGTEYGKQSQSVTTLKPGESRTFGYGNAPFQVAPLDPQLVPRVTPGGGEEKVFVQPPPAGSLAPGGTAPPTGGGSVVPPQAAPGPPGSAPAPMPTPQAPGTAPRPGGPIVPPPAPAPTAPTGGTTGGLPTKLTPAQEADINAKIYSITPPEAPQPNSPGYDVPQEVPYSAAHPYETNIPPSSQQAPIRITDPKNRAEFDQNYRNTSNAMTEGQQQLQTVETFMRQVGKIFNDLGTGAWTTNRASVVSKLDALHLNITDSSTAQDVQLALKDRVNSMLQTLQSNVALHKVAEKVIQQVNASYIDPDSQPTTNYNIVAEKLAPVLQTQAMIRDWRAAQVGSWRGLDPAAFQADWMADPKNSIEKFTAQAKAEIGFFKDMPDPDRLKWGPKTAIGPNGRIFEYNGKWYHY